jgi:glycosyltransferase involved in cell wall biosynthesis
MHIGIDALLLHGDYSGVEQSIYRLLVELSKDGGPHEYSVYVARGFGAGHLSRPGFEFRRLGFPGGSKLRRALFTQTAFARRARSDGVDLLHGPGYILPRGWRGPAVVTVYDVIALTHPHLCTWPNALYYAAFLPRTISRADAVIVPAEAVKADILEHVGVEPAKVHVAPLGVGEEFTPDIPAERKQAVVARYGIAAPYLLCVGNIEPKKNLAATVEAFAFARRKARLPHQLVLAGGKSWGSKDVEVALSGLEAGVVRRTGYVDQRDLPALVAGADALLMWSLVEGFGLPAIEAMAAGTPVICSDRGALPEVVGDAAMIYPIAPVESFAKAIIELLDNVNYRERLIEKGLRRAREFTWRKHADAVLEVYREVGDHVG